MPKETILSKTTINQYCIYNIENFQRLNNPISCTVTKEISTIGIAAAGQLQNKELN